MTAEDLIFNQISPWVFTDIETEQSIERLDNSQDKGLYDHQKDDAIKFAETVPLRRSRLQCFDRAERRCIEPAKGLTSDQ